MILSSTESNHNFFSYVSEKRKEYSFQNDIFSTIFALLNKSRERQQPGKCIGSNTEYIYHSGIFYENRSGAEIFRQIAAQDRKTNSFVRFLGESAAQQFCFEIY